MIQLIVLALVLLLAADRVDAATYWVSPSGAATLCNQIDGDTDPGAYMTPSAIASNTCTAAGDTVVWKAGTYTGARVQFTAVLPPGTSSSVVSRHVCENDRGCVIAFSSVSNGTGVINTLNATHYRIGALGAGFVADCVNGGDGCGGVYLQLSGSIIATNVVVENVLVRNHHATAFNMSEQQPTNYYDGATWRYVENEAPATPYFTGGGAPHGLYIKGWNVVAEHSKFISHDLAGSYAMHGWHNTRHARVRYNVAVVPPSARGVTLGDDETRPAIADNWVYHNIITCPTLNCGLAISFVSNNRNNGARAYNNTVYGFSNFLIVGVDNHNSHFVNNVCAGGSCSITNSGTNLNCEGTCSTTNPTVTAASHFTNAASGDFSLISTSTLINAGIDVGLPFNGSNPDRGAHETFTQASARIDGVNLDITFGMNLNTPVIGGTGGFTVACSPTCGTITVTGVTRIADSVLRLTTSGWSGGFCVDTQTITASYASGSGTASDSARIGNTNNQPLHSFSNFAVTNQCSGSSGPAPPAGSLQYLKLNGNATDDSGNANNGTVSGGSFVAARYGQGWQGEAGVESYVDTGLLNGFNPATQAFTIAYGVFIPEGEVGITRNLGGFNLGSGQRLHVYKHGSTQNFRLATQTNAGGTATEFSVTAGWHHVCINGNGSGTITLWINGTAGTVSGASVQTVTSYVTASTYRIGVPSGISASNSGAHIYDEFLIYNTAGHCANLWAAWEQQTPPPGSGTLTQVAVQAQELYTVSGNPVNYGAPNTRVDVIDGGAIAHVYQINCDPGPCDATSLHLRYEVDGGGFNQVVPDTPTADGVYFYGSFNTARANTGSAGAALTGSLSHTAGSTQLTSSATPSVDLGDDSSITLRYIVRFTNGNIGKIYKFRLYDQTGLPLDAYTNDGHVRIVKKRMRGRF